MARENKRNRDARRLATRLTALQITRETMTAHSGPIPDPETLARYDQMMPGLANRIVAMAEAEATHRRGMEKDYLGWQIEDSKAGRFIEKRGQLCAFAIAIVAMVGGFWLIAKGHPIAGSSLSGGTLATLVGVFIYGRERSLSKTEDDASESDEKPEQKRIEPPPKEN